MPDPRAVQRDNGSGEHSRNGYQVADFRNRSEIHTPTQPRPIREVLHFVSDVVYPVDRRNTAVRKLHGDAMTVTHARFPAFTSARHAHERAMCTLTLDGHWTQRLRGRSHRCVPGMMLTKDAGETHVDQFEPPGIEVLMIEVASERSPHLRSGLMRLLDVPCVAAVEVQPLARRLVRELATPDDLTPMVVEGLVLELLGMSARHHATSPARLPPRWVERARELLLANLERPLRIADVARVVDVHPVRLARGFRTFLGISPGGFVRRARLERAACELISTQRSLAEIAQWAGFGDQSHFTRAFKRHTGLPPGKYRLAVRPQNDQSSAGS